MPSSKKPESSEQVDGAKHVQGKKYYFCAPGCKKAFDETPEKFLGK